VSPPNEAKEQADLLHSRPECFESRIQRARELGQSVPHAELQDHVEELLKQERIRKGGSKECPLTQILCSESREVISATQLISSPLWTYTA
jgi:hypothetical protein